MIDSPQQARPHFPAAAAAPVKRQIAALLKRLDARIGYASAACGSDVLFHECLQERGGESNVVLPFDRDEFFRTSVRFAGPSWGKRAGDVIAGSTTVEQATRGGYGGEDLLFSYANRLIVGKAILRSRFLETEPLLVAVWDGARVGKPGGTSECIQLWDQTGFPSIVIDPATAAVKERKGRDLAGRTSGGRKSAGRASGGRASEGRASGGRAAPARAAVSPRRQTMAILFADMVGYSRLAEEQIPAYVRGFLHSLADTLRKTGSMPVYKNTWGDAICFAFADPLQAAECAIAMRDMVRTTDWSRHKLPRSLSVRIGLHAGPVYCAHEPVLDRLNVFGFHVNQAARIEPITSPGNVYASESFAALLLADPRNPYDCRYVGIIVLPKRFGSYPIYHIKRKTEVG
jgi:class 3 adenylate cyclase